MGRPPPRRQTKRAAGTQTHIALWRYSNMGPSFPLFLPADEAPHAAWYTLTARFASRWGVARPWGRSARLHRVVDLAISHFFATGLLSSPAYGSATGGSVGRSLT